MVSTERKVSEAGILEVLRRHPGVSHTHWPRGGGMMLVYDPSWPDAPEKLLLARLRAMKRKRLIDGCGCGCAGFWAVTA